MAQIEMLFGLLAAVAALTWLAQRVNVEYPIFLVLGGLVLGFIPGLPQVALQPNVVFLVFLPPLLYYEAFASSLRDFRAILQLIILNAVFLVIVTIAAVAVVSHALVPGITWAGAVVFGAIVGPTDETAALAVASRLRVPRRLITAIKAESLFNDATSLVIFNLALVASVSGTFSWASGLFQLIADGAGGVVIGLAVGWIFSLIRRNLDDLMLQNTVSLLTGYAAYFPADALHFSGVLAALTAGLYLGRQGAVITSAESRVQIVAMRDITLFMINGILFLLVGLQLNPILAGMGITAAISLALAAIAVSVTVIVVRIVWILSTHFLPRLLSRTGKVDRITSFKYALVVAWTGLRGGISLAAALAVPLTVALGAAFPARSAIVLLTFAVILATLVGQGLTLNGFIKSLGITAETTSREESLARLKVARAARDTLAQLAKETWADADAVQDARTHLEHAITHYKDVGEAPTPELRKQAEAYRRIQAALSDAQMREVLRLYDEGAIAPSIMRKLQRELDLEELRSETTGSTA
ncbi:MAG TPA: Na+/H+ antiporter [Candidatus Eremiobacteraceae bacterium]|nr:Na+/H+ antiporter [Candidatus Eremiobacteraceae bacterium]